MHLNDRVIRLPRRAAAMAATVPAALLVAGLATGVASAAPGEDITGKCVEVSQNGSPWKLVDESFAPTNTDYTPIPGGEGVLLAFDVRNTCAVPATLTIYSENWTVGDNATATVRGAIDGVEGNQFEIGPGKDASAQIVLKQKVLPRNVATPIEYLVGIPKNETNQGYEITPGWGFKLVEDVRTVAPGAPTDLNVTPGSIETGGTVTVSGTAEGGSTVTVTGGGQACTITADELTGAFSCDLEGITELGKQDITVTAENTVGVGPAATTTVTVTDPDEPGDGDSCEANGSVVGSLGSLGSTGSLGSVSDFLCNSGGSLGSLVDRN